MVKDRAKKRRQVVRDAKNKPCFDCGILYPYWIMQFDHVRGIKNFNIGTMWYKKGLQKILEEIEKCDIVCANCHAERTFRRKEMALSYSG